ncbi:Magnesium-dependent phosphatase 1 [Gryllus bimaculatus]|nr:Magnesium-dependent phosphatase 1 [Gryllus bimaculatus]
MDISSKTPKIIVFDLDRTLWPFQVDKDTTNPFRRTEKNTVEDASGKLVSTFPQVFDILHDLISRGFVLGVASRIEDIMGAYQLLELFNLNSFFTYKEIYPTSKIMHFKELHRKTGFPYETMVFFDDDERNIKAVQRLGVQTFQVSKDGIDKKFVLQSLNLDSSH